MFPSTDATRRGWLTVLKGIGTAGYNIDPKVDQQAKSAFQPIRPLLLLASAALAPYALAVTAAVSTPRSGDATLYGVVLAISAVALAPLVYVLTLRDTSGSDSGALSFMPAVNASLNGLAAAFQIAGYLAIRKKRQALHKASMIAAVAASAGFFVCYLIYHYVHGDTKYPGTGPIRVAYLLLLASHVILSIVLVPMLLVTLYRAARGTFAKHRALARITLPIWLYVSVTGIVVFWMLRGAQ